MLDLEQIAKVSAPYCARLFDERAALRPIFLAASMAACARVSTHTAMRSR